MGSVDDEIREAQEFLSRPRIWVHIDDARAFEWPLPPGVYVFGRRPRFARVRHQLWRRLFLT